MSKFDKSMFERIKGALTRDNSGGGQFSNIMKFPDGNTFVIRLLPVTEEGKEPLFHHWVNSWKSKATGTYTSALSLKTFNEKDPISNLRWKQWKAWRDVNPKADPKEYNGDISEKEQWLVNVLVIDNPVNPEENGTVKIFRFGPQIKEIIDIATEGARADEFGWGIFDPTAGFDLKIVAEKQGIYTTFKNSFFTDKTKKNLSDDDVDTIYQNLYDLEQVYPVKTYDELEQLLNDHYFCDQKSEDSQTGVSSERKQLSTRSNDRNVEDHDDEIPMKHEPVVVKSTSNKSVSQSQVDDLLDGLDID